MSPWVYRGRISVRFLYCANGICLGFSSLVLTYTRLFRVDQANRTTWFVLGCKGEAKMFSVWWWAKLQQHLSPQWRAVEQTWLHPSGLERLFDCSAERFVIIKQWKRLHHFYMWGHRQIKETQNNTLEAVWLQMDVWRELHWVPGAF